MSCVEGGIGYFREPWSDPFISRETLMILLINVKGDWSVFCFVKCEFASYVRENEDLPHFRTAVLNPYQPWLPVKGQRPWGWTFPQVSPVGFDSPQGLMGTVSIWRRFRKSWKSHVQWPSYSISMFWIKKPNRWFKSTKRRTRGGWKC